MADTKYQKYTQRYSNGCSPEGMHASQRSLSGTELSAAEPEARLQESRSPRVLSLIVELAQSSDNQKRHWITQYSSVLALPAAPGPKGAARHEEPCSWQGQICRQI